MRLRPPSPVDAPAVLAVVTARDRADIGEADYTLDDLRDEWGATEIDLGADTQVVEVDGAIAAYGIVHPRGTRAAVAPEFEGRGIGSRLLGWAEAREREQARRPHRQWITHGNPRATTLLLDAGYTLIRSYWRMSLVLGDAQVPTAPPRLVLRSLDIDRDAVDIHAVDALSFAATPDYDPMPLEVFRERHLHAHDFDATLSRVAERDGGIVGFLLARRWAEEGIGFVDVLGVHPGHRRQGVGTALLRSAFERFAAAGLERGELGVASDNPDALKLYERIGMKPRFQSDTYERELTPRGQPPDR
ncbi:MAG TPA: GNAT family N-acetyltransferase [Solirubrobacteraceae bacterium]|nr:GNAT family N-acetyltransferase [Solirubrobacteraceae bacterium]